MPIPLAGHINFASIFGSLVEGQGATSRFDGAVASGSVTLYAKKNEDKHDLYLSFSLNTELHGLVGIDDFKLVTLS